jgi:hypothetical protein
MQQRVINDNFWQEYEITENEILCLNLRTLCIWCMKKGSELLISHRKMNDGEHQENLLAEAPEDLDWSRWAVEQEKIRIRVLPVFPDRSVVVKPELSFRLVERTQVRVFVRVPIWVRIELVGKTPETLLEIPSVILSNTWFGSFLEGELCYWISSGIRRKIEPDPNRPYLAICPVKIVEDTDEELLIEKLCLRVQNLSMFYDGQQLWSDQTKIYYKGKGAISQIEVAHSAPKDASKSKLISKPRSVIKKGITAKTFSTLKELPGFGFFTA